MTEPDNSAPALNFTTFLAAILMVSPVRGLRPSRAERSETDQEPNPTKDTRPPPLRALPTLPKKDSNAFFAAAFEMPWQLMLASPKQLQKQH